MRGCPDQRRRPAAVVGPLAAAAAGLALAWAASPSAAGAPGWPAGSGAYYADRPPAAHTGGFGEPSCHSCHFDSPVDHHAGETELSGVPPEWVPGVAYDLVVRVRHRDLRRGGFQVSARLAGREGEGAGTQAGSWELADDDRTAAVELDGVTYTQHTERGTWPEEPGSIEWRLVWRAPPTAAGRVVFHLAANAANGDDSELGDFIYLVEAWTRPGK